MTTWDKSQCGEVQGSVWEGDCQSGGGVVGQPCGADVLLLTTTPYAIGVEDSLEFETTPVSLALIRELTRQGEDDLTFGVRVEALEWTGNNGYADDQLKTEIAVTRGLLFSVDVSLPDRVTTDVAILGGSLYGIFYDKAFDRVTTDSAITGGSLAAG
jgi:hypothetical protein